MDCLCFSFCLCLRLGSTFSARCSVGSVLVNVWHSSTLACIPDHCLPLRPTSVSVIIAPPSLQLHLSFWWNHGKHLHYMNRMFAWRISHLFDRSFVKLICIWCSDSLVSRRGVLYIFFIYFFLHHYLSCFQPFFNKHWKRPEASTIQVWK